jgi:PAS domain S-box-containing protein
MHPENKFLKSVFEVTHLEFQEYDLSQNTLVFSSGMNHRLLGYTEEEYRNLSTDFYRKIIHPDDFKKAQAALDELIHSKKGEVIELTIRARKKDGAYIWLYSRQMIYERVPGNKICTIIRESEDVTRLVEAEQQLAKKVELLKEISYKNSHLVRSPVASIIGLVGLIEEHGINGEHNRQIFQFLKEAITKLDEVIHEINDAARE